MPHSQSPTTYKHEMRAMYMLPFTVLLWDQHFKCVELNKASVCNFTALDSAFLKGQQLGDLPLSRDFKSLWTNRFQQVAAHNESNVFCEQVFINGSAERIETQLQPLHDAEIGETLVMSFCRKQPMEQNDSLGAAWNAYFRRRSNDVFLLTADGIVEDVNKTVQGKSREFWIGHRFSDILHDKDQPVFESLLRRAREEGEPVRMELPVEHRWYAVSLAPWMDKGDTEKHIIVELEDVAREHTSRIEEQGLVALLNDALSGAEEAISLLHAEGRIIYRNEAARALLSGNVIHLQDLQLALEGKLLYSATAETLDVGELNVFKPLDIFSKQRIGILSRGVVRTFESTVQPLHRTEKDSDYVLWTLRDVSRDERMIRNLMEEKEEMNHILRATSHDLRSSVSNIANLSRLLRQGSSPEQTKLLCEKLISTSDTLQHLLGSMIELARMDVDTEEENTAVHLDDMMAQVTEMLPAELLTDNVLVTADFAEEEIVFNQHYLRSILYNLVVNAIKYGDPQKESIEVRVASRPATNGIWLEVSDNGIGMDLIEIKDDLFKPFTRFTGKSKGSGIGLSLVKHFTEKNGGEVHVESEPGKGTTFKLLLLSYQQSSGQYELF